MAQIYVQSSQAVQDVINQLTKELQQFDQAAQDIEKEQNTLTTKWKGDASTAFNDTFNKQKPNFTTFHDAIESYIKALSQILQQYETTEANNTNIAKA
ncbi:MAG: WXG100 family type VII secretion target [Lachnospiraceae bacterium]|jgi:WXG100 family type VII secretion target